MRRFRNGISAFALTIGVAVGAAGAQEIKFPSTVVWTAYDVGSSGYSQVVGIGSVLKNRYGTNIRVLPGKNDVARLSPLRDDKAQLSATGSDSIYAQEAVYVFGTEDWGPQPIRILVLNVGDGCAVAFPTAADSGVTTMQDLKGKPVAMVRGAPALIKATEAMLAHADMTLDDIVQVPVSSVPAGVDAIINGDAITTENATFSTNNKRLEASPRGVTYLPQPHDDEAGWERLRKVVPWYFKHVCAEGPGLSATNTYEGVGTGYPILVGMERLDDELAYATTRAMFEHFDEYKDSAPGGKGWAMDRQQLENYFLPYHDGAIRYYKEIGKWTDAAQRNHENNLKRQQVLMDSWAEYKKSAPDDEEAFNKGWMEARKQALESAEMAVVFDSW